MQKIILPLLMSFSLNSFAQKSFFGIDAGINVANQRQHVDYGAGFYPESSTSFFKNLIAPNFGVFFQFRFNEKTGLRLNAQYTGLGYTNYDHGTNINGEPFHKLYIYYFRFPMTFHYSIDEHLSFNAGPYLSFTYQGNKINGTPITSLYHKNDNGFSFGAEYVLYKNIAIGVNYIFGLKNIWLNDNIYEDFQVQKNSYTNRALQITLIYKFKKKS